MSSEPDFELECPHCQKAFGVALNTDDYSIDYYVSEGDQLAPGEERGLGGLKVTGMDFRASAYENNGILKQYQVPENMKPLSSVNEEKVSDLLDEKVAAMMEEKIQAALNKDLLDRGITNNQKSTNENNTSAFTGS